MVQQLSSGNPATRRILAIILIISAPIFGLAVLISQLKQPTKDVSPAVALTAIMGLVSIYLLWSCSRLKIVSMDDRYLYIEDPKNSIKLALDQMQEAHFVRGGDPWRRNAAEATILLKSDTIFGREITFIPIRGKKTVQELIELIVSIQNRNDYTPEDNIAKRTL